MRVVQPVDTSPNTSDEHSDEQFSEEMPIKMIDAEIQVSDDSKDVKRS